MQKIITRERFTVLASAAVAIAILGAAVTAQPSRTKPSERLIRLESDLRYQIALDAKMNPPAFRARSKKLDEVLDAWKKSPQSADDSQLLTAWLRQALSQSMPGASGDWPASPEFSSEALKPADSARPTVAKKPVAEPQAPSAAATAPDEQEEKRTAKLKRTEEPAASSAKLSPPRAMNPKTNEQVDPAKPFIVHISDPVPIGAEAQVLENPIQPKMSNSGGHDSAAEPKPEEGDERTAPTAADTAAIYNEPPTKAAPAESRTFVEERVEVNLAELNARIGGYHDGLREVEAAVIARRERMTAAQAAKLVARLESLAAQCAFVRLYYSSLTDGEREFVMAPQSMAGTIDLVTQQCSRVELEGDEDHFSMAEGSPGKELLRRLQKLSEATDD